MIIAIDGPAASGKSTTARKVAQQLEFLYLDTGAMYRCVTLALLDQHISISDVSAVNNLLESIDVNLSEDDGNPMVHLNKKNVTDKIRSAEVTSNVSAVSAIREVRKAMVRMQRKIASNSNCVMEGRDIGTVVFPNAEVKIFLVADANVRAVRRQKDLLALGEMNSVDELVKEIEKRDAFDSTREHSPLQKAKDAFVIDTSHVTIDEQVSEIIEIVNQKKRK
ncbi:MAG: (d)CMP kinase [Candidatus Marinimicrobia bacterium]|jgi:cytidylate kinase|nr:(d)CMP kinase [Candidatus Neomarinimicrobiota bacterium]MBT3618534.1 (d)CMP kinase [Candidatus Neomarinimicrobiota bacterium]MBT3828940.1 (d)CMP kinase [Candidatus Neomarinimicrobiota bacterium]MBT3997324.1 (d)CMP kinase [Candidatus Neomarinimicrobiota bacterium]MBT4281154.1 (d)CMP kinase [Candidatus Neomarinimicrobiota bacterium]